MGLDVAGLLGRHNTAQYRDALLALLPQGHLWDAERKNTKGGLYRLCGVWAQEYAKLEQTLYQLHSEAAPSTMTELEPWAEAAGVSLREGNESVQKAKILATLIGSHASTIEGLKAIGQLIGYTISLKPYPEQAAPSGYSKRIWKFGNPIRKQMVLSSKSVGFQALANEIAAEQVGHCGVLRCGKRLWPSGAAIHQTLAAKPKHETVRKEAEILEKLLPAHYSVDTRYQLAG